MNLPLFINKMYRERYFSHRLFYISINLPDVQDVIL